MPPPSLVPDSTFAGFRVLRLLSEGGMGAVYVVEQPSTGKQRALKVMHPSLVEDSKLRQRFVQEAKIGSRIESDHVVEVLDAGVDAATGMPWLTMELLRGETLAARSERRGALPANEVAEIFAQLGHALAAAHDAGIVHRDLKPENVFLAVPRREGVPFMVKVLDFGIAKMVAEVQTRSTAAIGTPLWMAPEQTESGGRILPATDVWALGLIAFRLLTGRSYWLGASAENPSAMALLREVAIDPLVLASTRAAQLGVSATLPAGFDEWFAQCVVRDPSQRHPHARDARNALEAILGKPESARIEKVNAPEMVAKTVPMGPAATSGPVASAIGATGEGGRWRTLIWLALALPVGLGVFFGVREWRKRKERVVPTPTNAPVTSAASDVAPQAADCPPKMALLPAGSFAMGDAKRVVTMKKFCLDIAEVTVEAYEACAKTGRCSPPATTIDWPGLQESERAQRSEACNAGRADRHDHPMNCVDANQAEVFCASSGKRLPSEEEWEWAARSGEHGWTYPWGDDDPRTRVCWSGATKRVSTCPVGSFWDGDNFRGVHDLAGNVQEWTASRVLTDAGELRAVRGGSWLFANVEDVRATARTAFVVSTRSVFVGIRCARDP